jgi:hypothetical protein
MEEISYGNILPISSVKIQLCRALYKAQQGKIMPVIYTGMIYDLWGTKQNAGQNKMQNKQNAGQTKI